MNILLIQKEGVDLQATLSASETSRLALRFYHPKRRACGVTITVSTLGSALSLISELRWYTRRYVREVLFEIAPGIFCTHLLARDVYYERSSVLAPTWPYRRLCAFRSGKVINTIPIAPGSRPEEYHQEYIGADRTIEIWCMEDEVEVGELLAADEDDTADGAE